MFLSLHNLVAKSKTTSIHLGLRRIIFNLNVYKMGTSNVVPKCTLYNIVHMNRKSIASTHPFKSTDWLSSKNHWSIDTLFRASFVICLIKKRQKWKYFVVEIIAIGLNEVQMVDIQQQKYWLFLNTNATEQTDFRASVGTYDCLKNLLGS